MFHVDPQNNTSIDTNTTPPDTVGLADDVIVGKEGNVGVGMFPEAGSPPLTLTGGGTPSAPKSPLRIEDGNQQEGRVLTSNDAYGNAYWKDLPGGIVLGKIYGLHEIPVGHFPYISSVSSAPTPSGFSFTADAAGSYVFEVRWWGKYVSQVSLVNYIHFYLVKNDNWNTPEDQFEQYIGPNATDLNAFTVCFSLYSEAAVGDVFTLRLRQYDRPNTTGMDTQDNPAWQQGKVNVLRVN
jgi:hypothetical protein